MLRRQNGLPIVAQCPQPSDDKVAVVNAQTTAIALNRRLGGILHELTDRDFLRTER